MVSIGKKIPDPVNMNSLELFFLNESRIPNGLKLYLEKELNKWKQLYQQEKSKRIKPEYDNTFGEDKYDMKDDKKFTVKKEEKKEYREHSDDYDDMITID